ncbi:MAG: hypothetical protein LBO69_05990 [Ignavibacteria bacterium]|jgi:hypothetical protein|nr:hypothetical protein [Ignavibacteria bacterium]
MGFLNNLFKSDSPDLEEKKAVLKNIKLLHSSIVVAISKGSVDKKDFKDDMEEALRSLGDGFAGQKTGIFESKLFKPNYSLLKSDKELLEIDLEILQLAADTLLKIKEETKQPPPEKAAPDLEEKKAVIKKIKMLHSQIVVAIGKDSVGDNDFKDDMEEAFRPLGAGFAGDKRGIFSCFFGRERIDFENPDYRNLQPDNELLGLDLEILQLAADTLLKIKEDVEKTPAEFEEAVGNELAND